MAKAETLWSEAEFTKLRELYPTNKNKDLALVFNRSKISIDHVGHKLGLKKDRKYFKPILSIERSGENGTNWQGGRWVHKDGYIVLTMRGYPGADKRGSIFEHRYVMEQHIGRLLLADEIVHHKNGNRQDNSIDNLQLLTRSEHIPIHHIGRKNTEESKRLMSKVAKERAKKKRMAV